MQTSRVVWEKSIDSFSRYKTKTMDEKLIENIVNATLYEGYLLYPYRASSVKNLQRFNFGVLAPKIFSQMQYGTDAWQMQTECLVLADDETTIDVKINFLHLLSRQIGK